MQNTMVRGMGMASWGKNKNMLLGEKIKEIRGNFETFESESVILSKAPF